MATHVTFGLRGRLPAAVMQVLSVAFALVELGRLTAAGSSRNVVIGTAAALIFLPLHAQHLRYGLRDLRPPRGELTLGVMVVVNAVALVLIGPLWAFMLAILATSGLIVLSPARALVLLLACFLATLLRSVASAQVAPISGNHVDLVYGLLVRAVVQFALVRLVAVAYQLALAQDALTAEAAAMERARLEARVRAAVQTRVGHVQQIAVRARQALEDAEVAETLLSLDEIVRLSADALAELRRIVARTHTAAAEAADRAAAKVAAADAAPIGRALAASPASRLAALVYAVYTPFPLLLAVGALGFPASRHPAAAVAAWVALVTVLSGLALETAAGRRPRWAPIAVAGLAVLSLGLVPLLGELWIAAAPMFAAGAALVFRARLRLVCVLAVVAIELADGVGVDLAHATFTALPGLGLLGPVAATAWFGFYEMLITIFAIGGLYAAPRLVALVSDLKSTRADLARASVAAERRRLSGDLHDLLGQSLTALSLKADLARRLARTDRARSEAELDDIVRLAGSHLDELNTSASGARPVTFKTELDQAQELLGTAGVFVDCEVRLDGLDLAASAVLGWVVREGTTNILRHAQPTRCTLRAVSAGDEVRFELVNDGVLGPAGATGTGLGSLAERVYAVNGTFNAQQDDSGSFRLQVMLPALVRT